MLLKATVSPGVRPGGFVGLRSFMPRSEASNHRSSEAQNAWYTPKGKVPAKSRWNERYLVDVQHSVIVAPSQDLRNDRKEKGRSIKNGRTTWSHECMDQRLPVKVLSRTKISAPRISLDRATGVIVFELQASYRIAASTNRRLFTPSLDPHTHTQARWQTGTNAPRLIGRTEANRRSWAPFIGLLVTVVFCAAAWILAPKGENQTYVRSLYLFFHDTRPSPPVIDKYPQLRHCRRLQRARRHRICHQSLNHELDSHPRDPPTS